MMKSILAVLFVAQLLLPTGYTAQQNSPQTEDTGNELLSQCTQTLRLLDSETHLTPVESVGANYCSGYLQGFLDGYVVSGTMEKRLGGSSHPLFCLPEGGIHGDQEVRIVVKWLRDHPEQLHMPKRVLVVLALEQAFPCK